MLTIYCSRCTCLLPPRLHSETSVCPVQDGSPFFSFFFFSLFLKHLFSQQKLIFFFLVSFCPLWDCNAGAILISNYEFFFQAPLRNLLRILERGFVLQLEVDIFY